MKKVVKYIVITILVLGAIYGLFILSLMVGNPITRIKIKIAANKYIETNYKDKDYFIDKGYYNFKDENYYVVIKSKSSKDTYFDLIYNSKVKFIEDTYKKDVLSGSNTANRIDMKYKEIVELFLKNKFKDYLNFGYGTIVFSDKYDKEKYLNMKDLILDKDYDINEFAKEAGYITVYFYDNNLDFDRAKELLIKLKEKLDEESISFYAIDFNLSLAEHKYGTDNDIIFKNILYSDFNSKDFAKILSTKSN
ncbi:MAG: hypothetical protein GX951_05595 [Mollicutes bacterium]|nr:hypothetical protein [Mollicutes bacterium]